MSPFFLGQYADTDSYRDLMQAFDIEHQLSGRNCVIQSLYLWTKTMLANYILRTVGDGSEMANSVEGRPPFLDHKLFEFARRLPLSLKINGTVEKYLLREAIRPLITDTVYRRQKHPFMAPPLSQFSNKVTFEKLRDTLDSTACRSLPFFEHKKITNLVDSLSNMEDEERQASDPIFMMIMSASILQQRYHL